ncbi:MAG: ATP-binding protein [Desertifilum sp.]|nr:ATP-binding protein [Desertifilum sp.]
MKFWKQHLTSRLASYFLLLSLLTVSTISCVAYLQARQSLKESAFNQLSITATLKEGELARWFEDQQRDFLLTTHLPDVQTRLQTLLETASTTPQHQQAKADLDAYLQRVIRLKPNLQEIYVLDGSSRVLLSSQPERERTYEIAANITFLEQVAIGADFAPIFYVSPRTRKPAITLATPIRNANGDRIGLLATQLDLERIDRIIREGNRLGKTGEAYLVGFMVTGNAFISGASPLLESSTESVTSFAIEQAMLGQNGSGLYLNYAGVPVIGVYRWLNNRDLALLVEMAQAEALAPARQLAVTIALIGAFSAIALSVGVYWLSRQITKPILAIAETSTQIAAGELDREAPILTEDEIGILAHNFNQMLRQLKLSRNQSQAYSDSLEQKAHELEQTLQQLRRTQAQLIQTEKMSSLGQLVAGIAHEINNPINFIYGNVSHVSRYTEDLLHLLALYDRHYSHPLPEIEAQKDNIDLEFLVADLPKILESMQVGAERISQIVKALRSFSRLDQAQKKPVDIHEGIESTLAILQSRLREQKHRPAIQVIKDYGTLPQVECYAGQLNQVFMHILSNAIDTLDEKYHLAVAVPEPQIAIRTELLEDRVIEGIPKTIQIQISDNGVGMSPTVLAKIFDPFFTTKPVGSGTGLGLAICYSIVVEHHGGELNCHSTPGKGTEFTLQIPYR